MSLHFFGAPPPVRYFTQSGARGRAIHAMDETPELTLEKVANRETYSAVGDAIVYTYTVTNSGNVELPGPFTVTDDKLGTMPCGSGPLPVGAAATCASVHSIVQADLDAGSITNRATASTDFDGETVTSNPAQMTVTAVEDVLVARLSPQRRAAREHELRRMAAAQRPFAERLRIATHEAGHAVVALAAGCRVERASIVGTAELNGFCEIICRHAVDGHDAASGDELVAELERRAGFDMAGAIATRPKSYAYAHEVVIELSPAEAEQAFEQLQRAHGCNVEAKFREVARRTQELLAKPLERERVALIADALMRQLELDERGIVAAVEPAGRPDPESRGRVLEAQRRFRLDGLVAVA